MICAAYRACVRAWACALLFALLMPPAHADADSFPLFRDSMTASQVVRFLEHRLQRLLDQQPRLKGQQKYITVKVSLTPDQQILIIDYSAGFASEESLKNLRGVITTQAYDLAEGRWPLHGVIDRIEGRPLDEAAARAAVAQSLPLRQTETPAQFIVRVQPQLQSQLDLLPRLPGQLQKIALTLSTDPTQRTLYIDYSKGFIPAVRNAEFDALRSMILSSAFDVADGRFADVVDRVEGQPVDKRVPRSEQATATPPRDAGKPDVSVRPIEAAPVVAAAPRAAASAWLPSNKGVSVQGTHGVSSNLVAKFDDLMFTLAEPFPKAVDVLVTTDQDRRANTSWFRYDPKTGKLRVRSDKANELHNFANTNPQGLLNVTLTAPNLMSQFAFIYAPSQVQGRLVDANGTVLTALKGRAVALKNAGSLLDVATVKADGTFAFRHVPYVHAELELREDDKALLAQGVVAPRWVHEAADIDLEVTQGPIPKAGAPLSGQTFREQSQPLAVAQVNLSAAFEQAGLARPQQYTVRQIAGPKVAFAVSSNYLNAMGPPNTGQNQQAALVVMGDRGRLKLLLDYKDVVSPVADDATDAPSDSPRIPIKGKVALLGTQGAARNLIKNFADLAFQIAAPRLPQRVNIYARGDNGGGDVEQCFSYDPKTGKLSVKPSMAGELAKIAGTQGAIEFWINGDDLASQVHLIHAPGSIQGRLVDTKGTVAVALQGRLVVLEDRASGYSEAAVITADGSFVFPAVPVGSFNLELRDPSTPLRAQVAVSLHGMGEQAQIDMLAIPRVSALGARSAGVSLASYANRTVLVYRSARPQNAPDVPRRSPPASATRGTIKCEQGSLATWATSYGVVSAARDATTTCKANHPIPLNTKRLRVIVAVTTDEFGKPTDKREQHYDDRVSYNVQLGSGLAYAGAFRVSEVKSTPDATTRVLEQCVDVSAWTAAGDIAATLDLQSTNIGDDAGATSVSAWFEPC